VLLLLLSSMGITSSYIKWQINDGLEILDRRTPTFSNTGNHCRAMVIMPQIPPLVKRRRPNPRPSILPFS
jgi:hypothetical protein